MKKMIKLATEIEKTFKTNYITMRYLYETEEHVIKMNTDVGNFTIAIPDEDIQTKPISYLIAEIVGAISDDITHRLFIL